MSTIRARARDYIASEPSSPAAEVAEAIGVSTVQACGALRALYLLGIAECVTVPRTRHMGPGVVNLWSLRP